jgi:hypothetical protein
MKFLALRGITGRHVILGFGQYLGRDNSASNENIFLRLLGPRKTLLYEGGIVVVTQRSFRADCALQLGIGGTQGHLWYWVPRRPRGAGVFLAWLYAGRAHGNRHSSFPCNPTYHSLTSDVGSTERCLIDANGFVALIGLPSLVPYVAEEDFVGMYCIRESRKESRDNQSKGSLVVICPCLVDAFSQPLRWATNSRHHDGSSKSPDY